MGDFFFCLFFFFVELWFDDFEDVFMVGVVVDDAFCSLFFPSESCLFFDDFDFFFTDF